MNPIPVPLAVGGAPPRPALFLGVVFAASLAAAAHAQNLLQNPSFESATLAPWTVVSGNVALGSYGQPDLPGAGVAQVIGGGSLMVRDAGAGILEQVVIPASIPAGSKLVVDGYLGAGLFDDTRMVVRFMTTFGLQVGFTATAFVTDVDRNFEPVLLHRQLVLDVPAAATRFAVRIEFRDDGCCNGSRSAADLFSAVLVTGSTTPPPAALDTELIVNGGFEAGWAPGSPLTPVGPYGWEGFGGAQSPVFPYSNTSGLIPNGAISCVLSGASPNQSCVSGAAVGHYLGHSGTTAVHQLIDVSGNTAMFASGALDLLLSVDLGGALGETCTETQSALGRRSPGRTAVRRPRPNSMARASTTRRHPMPAPISDRLACALGRRDEEPNVRLAEAIVAKNDRAAVRELADLLATGTKPIRSDAIKVLYEIGARVPELIAPHWRAFGDQLRSKHQRLVWGAMTALDHVAGVDPDSVATLLPVVLEAADCGSVIARDHAVFLLARLVVADVRRKAAWAAVLDLLGSCPDMQFPMYCERCVEAAEAAGRERFVAVLRRRQPTLAKATQQKRVQRVLARLARPPRRPK